MKLLCLSLLLCSASIFISCAKAREKLFFLQTGEPENDNEIKRKLLVVTWFPDESDETGGCEIFTDEELILEVLKSSNNPVIETPTEEEMESLLQDCTEIALRRKRRDTQEFNGKRTAVESSSNLERNFAVEGGDNTTMDRSRNSSQNNPESTTIPNDIQHGPTQPTSTEEGYSGWPVIWPGTKWCGAGDIAKNYDDLGLHSDTDRCCRAHDLCNDTMAPKETRNNLTNSSPFTKLSCQCDMDFYYCLDRVNSVTSNTIGNTYFNILKRECYTKDYPTTNKCKKYRSFLKITCKEYAKDTTAPQVYQWQSAKRYKKIPIPGPLTITLPF